MRCFRDGEKKTLEPCSIMLCETATHHFVLSSFFLLLSKTKLLPLSTGRASYSGSTILIPCTSLSICRSALQSSAGVGAFPSWSKHTGTGRDRTGYATDCSDKRSNFGKISAKNSHEKTDTKTGHEKQTQAGDECSATAGPPAARWTV